MTTPTHPMEASGAPRPPRRASSTPRARLGARARGGDKTDGSLVRTERRGGHGGRLVTGTSLQKLMPAPDRSLLGSPESLVDQRAQPGLRNRAKHFERARIATAAGGRPGKPPDPHRRPPVRGSARSNREQPSRPAAPWRTIIPAPPDATPP